MCCQLMLPSSSDPELMRGTLALTVVRGDVEFLKYIVNNNQSVDFSGEC